MMGGGGAAAAAGSFRPIHFSSAAALHRPTENPLPGETGWIAGRLKWHKTGPVQGLERAEGGERGGGGEEANVSDVTLIDCCRDMTAMQRASPASCPHAHCRTTQLIGSRGLLQRVREHP